MKSILDFTLFKDSPEFFANYYFMNVKIIGSIVTNCVCLC